MRIRHITEEIRQQANDFLQSHWFSTQIAVRGQLVDMTDLDGLTAQEDEILLGLITYRIVGNECEILSLDSDRENVGIGTALLTGVIGIAKRAHCKLIRLITTNDNTDAMRFYQKRGFDMACLYHDAVEASRKLKPSIPLIGRIRHTD